MDTKSKSNSFLGRILSAVIIGLVAAALLFVGNTVYHRMRNSMDAPEEQTTFIQGLYNYSYALYWKGEQREQEDIQLTPAELFFPDAERLMLQSNDDDEENRELEELEGRSFYWMSEAYGEFQSAWEDFDYYTWDENRGSVYGEGREELKSLAMGSEAEDEIEALQKHYHYYIKFHFDSEGKMSLPVLHGADSDSVYTALQGYDIESLLLNSMSGRNALTGSMEGPKDWSVVFAVPAGVTLVNSAYSTPVYDQALTMRVMGMEVVALIAILFVTGLGFAMMWLRREEFSPRWWARLPLEFSIAIPLLAWLFYMEPVLEWTVQYFSGTFLVDDPSALLSVGVIGAVVIWGSTYLPLLAIFFSALSIAQVRILGLKDYLRQRSLIVRFFIWIKRKWDGIAAAVKQRWKRIRDWFAHIDLRDSKNRALLRVLLLNLLVICILCLFNPAGLGMLGAVVFTIILFVTIRRRMEKIRLDYHALFDATAEMAKGNLHVPLDKNLGIFEPIKEELTKVQESFGEAVEAEVRSQKMKAELITNVSHDLKTPLTAIITYVDLLKDENITQEERKSYIDTLAQKSQRLKELINDLFEVSKASSNTMVFYPSTINIVSLIKQVENEWEDAYREAGLSIQNRFPTESLPVYLDGEKTSRVFENLFNNACKYSLAGTRVFVEAEGVEDEVRVSIKNLSREALDFDDDLITERFVRGDRSRNTEGSGLGLAIVKGFTENQGGRFTIETDGDLFKAIVVFPLWTPTQEELASEEI